MQIDEYRAWIDERFNDLTAAHILPPGPATYSYTCTMGEAVMQVSTGWTDVLTFLARYPQAKIVVEATITVRTEVTP